MWYPNNNFEDTYNVHVLLPNKNSYILVFFRKRGVTLIFHLPCDRIRVQNEEGRSCKNESCSFAQRDWEFTVYSKLFSECWKGYHWKQNSASELFTKLFSDLNHCPIQPIWISLLLPGLCIFQGFPHGGFSQLSWPNEGLPGVLAHLH